MRFGADVRAWSGLTACTLKFVYAVAAVAGTAVRASILVEAMLTIAGSARSASILAAPMDAASFVANH